MGEIKCTPIILDNTKRRRRPMAKGNVGYHSYVIANYWLYFKYPDDMDKNPKAKKNTCSRIYVTQKRSA